MRHLPFQRIKVSGIFLEIQIGDFLPRVFLKIGHFLDHRIHTAVAKRSGARHNRPDTAFKWYGIIPVVLKKETVIVEKFIQIPIVSLKKGVQIFSDDLTDFSRRDDMLIQRYP